MRVVEKMKNLVRLDGWQNFFTGMGMQNRDSKVHTGFGSPLIVDRRQLEDIFQGEGLGKKVVNLPTEDMTRKWWTLEGDTEDSVVKYLDEKLHLRQRMPDVLRWARLYGGAIGVLGINDGLGLESPVNQDTIEDLTFIHVFDRWQVQFTFDSMYADPRHAKFMFPEFYEIHPTFMAQMTDPSFRVHESRVIRLDGAKVPDQRKWENLGWGDSELQAPFVAMRNLGSVYDGCATIVDDFVTAVLTIENLQDMIASGQEDLVIKRLNILSMGKRMLNLMAISTGETYDKKASSVAGLPDLIDRFVEKVSCDTGIPVTRLMTKTRGGALGDSSKGEQDNWDDTVAAWQEKQLRDPFQYLADLAMRAKNGPTKGVHKPEWKVKFHPLRQETELEVIQKRKAQADVDKIYIDSAVVDASEIAICRFGGDTWSSDTKIDVASRKAQADAEREAAVKEAEMLADDPMAMKKQEAEIAAKSKAPAGPRPVPKKEAA